MRQIESEIARGVFVSRTEAEGTTLSEALDRYLIEVSSQKKGHSEASFVRWWQSLPMARRPMASIRGQDIAGAIKIKEAEGVGPKALVVYLGLLRHLFTIARKEWGMESLGNSVEMVRKPKLLQSRAAARRRPGIPHHRSSSCLWRRDRPDYRMGH